jgi:single-strand DNA-binding protein
MSYQKVIIVGNLGRDPEMRYTADGTPVTNLSVATNRRWNNSDGSKGEETVWFRVSVWRRQAEIAAQYLSKGRQVMVEGRMTPDKATGGPRTWQAQDGSWRASYEMTADRIVFLQGGGDASARGGGGSDDMGGPNQIPEDEIPF